MIKVILIWNFFLLIISFDGKSQTQADATRHARAVHQHANDDLEKIYNKILEHYKEDTVFLAQFKVSQSLWAQLRDAELKIKYPPRNPGYYGSIHSMCINLYLAELTNERISHLKIWLEGVEEGDACSGTMRRKE